MVLGIGCLASLLNLTTLTTVLIVYLPCIFMIFILFHQELLQRNFVATKTIIPASTKKIHDWVPVLIRTTLQAKAYNKSMVCIIEHHDALSAFLQTDYYVSAPIHEHLLNLIIENSSYDQTKLLWLQHTGTIMAYNTQVTENQHPIWHQTNTAHHQTIASLLVLTKKTDAIVLIGNPTSHGLTIIAHGKFIENVASHAAISIIKQYLHYSLEEAKQGERRHETNQPQQRINEQIAP